MYLNTKTNLLVVQELQSEIILRAMFVNFKKCTLPRLQEEKVWDLK